MEVDGRRGGTGFPKEDFGALASQSARASQTLPYDLGKVGWGRETLPYDLGKVRGDAAGHLAHGESVNTFGPRNSSDGVRRHPHPGCWPREALPKPETRLPRPTRRPSETVATTILVKSSNERGEDENQDGPVPSALAVRGTRGHRENLLR